MDSQSSQHSEGQVQFMDRLDACQIEAILNDSSLHSLVNSMSLIPHEHSAMLELPGEEYKPLMKSLNRLFARLKGLAVTETPVETVQTMQQHTDELTALDIALVTQFDETNEEVFHAIEALVPSATDLTLTQSKINIQSAHNFPQMRTDSGKSFKTFNTAQLPVHSYLKESPSSQTEVTHVRSAMQLLPGRQNHFENTPSLFSATSLGTQIARDHASTRTASYSDHTAVTRQEVNFRVIHHITEEDPSQEAPTYMQNKESFETGNESPLVHR
jgi:hypothetical protein